MIELFSDNWGFAALLLLGLAIIVGIHIKDRRDMDYCDKCRRKHL